MSQPVVDGDFSLSSAPFLPEDPRTLMERGDYSSQVLGSWQGGWRPGPRV